MSFHLHMRLLIIFLVLSFTTMITKSLNSVSKQACILRARFSLRRAMEADEVTVPSGLIAVNKPQDWSSSDVVGKVRNVLRNGAKRLANKKGKVKIKVGHGGTLDPLAEGVLVLGIGEGTKMLQQYLTGSKSYSATALLGTETDTLDSTGSVTSSEDWSHLTMSDVENALGNFRGNISQIPPMYSALKRDGKKLYDLARQGIEVERDSRPVTIYDLKLSSERKELPEFSLDVSCSGGTYIRTLCADIARSLNTRGHMTSLIRTKQGPFLLGDCLSLEDWDYEKLCKEIVDVSTRKEELPHSNDLKPALRLLVEEPLEKESLDSNQ